jgi:hypothetical protein
MEDKKQSNSISYWALLNVVSYGLVLPVIAGIFMLIGSLTLIRITKNPIWIIFPFILSCLIIFYVTLTKIWNLAKNKNGR